MKDDEMTVDTVSHSPLHQISSVSSSSSERLILQDYSASKAEHFDTSKKILVLRDPNGEHDHKCNNPQRSRPSDVEKLTECGEDYTSDQRVDHDPARPDRLIDCCSPCVRTTSNNPHDLNRRGVGPSAQPPDCLARIESDRCLYLVCKPRLTIGRQSAHSPADIDIDHKVISRAHLELAYGADGWRVRCNGKNGLTIDGQPVGKGAGDTVLPAECVLGFPCASIQLTFSTKGSKCWPVTGDERLVTSSIHPEDPSCSSNRCVNEARSKSSDDLYGVLENTPDFDGGYEQPENGDLAGASDDLSTSSNTRYSDDKDTKPPYSYAQLIVQAIDSTANRQMTLSGIYGYISKHYAYYRGSDKGWQNSIRHNLSLSRNFVRVPRSQDEPGKGSFWRMDPACEKTLIDLAFKKRRQAKTFGSTSTSLVGATGAVGVHGEPSTPADAPSPVLWHLGDAPTSRSSRDDFSPFSTDLYSPTQPQMSALPMVSSASGALSQAACLVGALPPPTSAMVAAAHCASLDQHRLNRPCTRSPDAYMKMCDDARLPYDVQAPRRPPYDIILQKVCRDAHLPPLDDLAAAQKSNGDVPRLQFASQNQLPCDVTAPQICGTSHHLPQDVAPPQKSSDDSRLQYAGDVAQKSNDGGDAQLPNDVVEARRRPSDAHLHCDVAAPHKSPCNDEDQVQYDVARYSSDGSSLPCDKSVRRSSGQPACQLGYSNTAMVDCAPKVMHERQPHDMRLQDDYTDNKPDLNNCPKIKQEIKTDANLNYGSTGPSTYCCANRGDRNMGEKGFLKDGNANSDGDSAMDPNNSRQVNSNHNNCLNKTSSLRLPVVPENRQQSPNVVHFKDNHETHEYEAMEYRVATTDSLDVPRRLEDCQKVEKECSLNSDDFTVEKPFCSPVRNPRFASKSAPPSPKPFRKHEMSNVERQSDHQDRVHHLSGGGGGGGGGSTFRVQRDAKDGRQRLQISYSPPRYEHVTSSETSALKKLLQESRGSRYSAAQLSSSSAPITPSAMGTVPAQLHDRPCSSASAATSVSLPLTYAFANSNKGGSQSLSTTPTLELSKHARYSCDAPSNKPPPLAGASSAQTKRCLKQRIHSGTGKVCGNGSVADPHRSGGFGTAKMHANQHNASMDPNRLGGGIATVAYGTANGQSSSMDPYSRGAVTGGYGTANGQSASIGGQSPLDIYGNLADLGAGRQLPYPNASVVRNIQQQQRQQQQAAANNVNSILGAVLQPSLGLAARALALNNQNNGSANSQSPSPAVPPQIAWPPLDLSLNFLLSASTMLAQQQQQQHHQQQQQSAAALLANFYGFVGPGGHATNAPPFASSVSENDLWLRLALAAHLDPSLTTVLGLGGSVEPPSFTVPGMGASVDSPLTVSGHHGSGAEPPSVTVAALGGSAAAAATDASALLIEQSRAWAAAQILAAGQPPSGSNKRPNSPRLQRDFSAKTARRH